MGWWVVRERRDKGEEEGVWVGEVGVGIGVRG